MNFDDSVYRNRAETGFVVKNDIGVLGAESIPVVSLSVLDAKIRDLWKVVIWAADRILVHVLLL